MSRHCAHWRRQPTNAGAENANLDVEESRPSPRFCAGGAGSVLPGD